MQIEDAQRELRSAYLGGFAGQLVSAVLWAVSGGLAVAGLLRAAMLFLVVAGVFIYPATQSLLRLLGRPGSVAPGNELSGLGAQVAFVLPLTLPLVGAATLHRPEWFYPAFMVALGAHYLPFVFLYGMPLFGALAALLWAAGLLLATAWPLGFSAGAWITAGLLAAFALLGRRSVLKEEAEAGAGGRGAAAAGGGGGGTSASPS